MTSIDAATTEQCIQEFWARLHAAVEREQANYEAEKRGEHVEWDPDTFPVYCPVCQIVLAEEAIATARETDRVKYGALPDWIDEQRVFACSDVHDRLWIKMQAHRGTRDYRQCFACQRTFRGSVAQVPIYTWPAVKVPLDKLDDLDSWGSHRNANDPHWAYRIKPLSVWGGGYGPGTRFLKEPEKEWRTVDVCSEACLDLYIYHLTEPLHFSDVEHVKVAPPMVATAAIVRVNETEVKILEVLTEIAKGLSANDIAEKTGKPLSTVQSSLTKMRRTGQVKGGGRRQPWLRVVGE